MARGPRAVAALLCLALLGAGPASAPGPEAGGVASHARGGTTGAWVHRAGTSHGIGSTEVPPDGGEERTAVVDRSVAAAGAQAHVRGPWEASSFLGSRVDAEAVLDEVVLVLAGVRVRVVDPHARATATCLADGTTTLEHHADVARVEVAGRDVAVEPAALASAGIEVRLRQVEVDPETGDVRAVAVWLRAPDGTIATVATAHAGLDCRPA